MATLTNNEATPASGEGGPIAAAHRIRYAFELFDTEQEAELRGTAIAVRVVDIPTRAERTSQPIVDSKFTVDVALTEAARCRQYPDPVLNEMAIVVLADEVLRLRESDAEIFTRAVIAGVARWEYFAGSIDRGEVCVDGFRYATRLNVGVPILHDGLRAVLERATCFKPPYAELLHPQDPRQR
jgi:hypothetical protein